MSLQIAMERPHFDLAMSRNCHVRYSGMGGCFSTISLTTMEPEKQPFLPGLPKPIQEHLSRVDLPVREIAESALHQALREDKTPIMGAHFDAVGHVGRYWYAIHDKEKLEVLGGAVALASVWYYAKEYGPVVASSLAAAIGLYLKIKKVTKLTKEQGFVLMALKAAERGNGVAPSEIAALLISDSSMSNQDVERVLEELSQLRFSDNTRAQLVECTEGRWRALDV